MNYKGSQSGQRKIKRVFVLRLASLEILILDTVKYSLACINTFYLQESKKYSLRQWPSSFCDSMKIINS